MVKALEIALEKMGMPNNWTWEDCCKAAVKQINDFEGWTKKSLIGNYRTVQRWHLAFRKNNECFLNKHSSKKGSTVLPPLLDTYPEAKEAIIKFASDRLCYSCRHAPAHTCARGLRTHSLVQID